MSLLLKIQIRILALVFTFYLIIRFFLCVPFMVFRFLISKLGRYWNSLIYKVVSSNMYLGQDGSLLVQSNLILSLRTKGCLNVRDAISRFQLNCISAEKNGRLLFPELKHKISLHLGYPCWVQDEYFDISNHIIGEELAAGQSCFTRENNFFEEPLDPDRSPWKILILLDRENDFSQVLFKCQHSLGDGVSVYNFLMKMADNPVPIQSPGIPKMGYLAWIWFNLLTLPTGFVRDITYMIQHPNPPFQSLSNETMSVCRTFVKSQVISKDLVRNIAKMSGKSFTGVLMGAISGAMREFLKKVASKEMDPLRNGSSQICCLLARAQSDKEGFTNRIRVIFPNLPLGTEDLEIRLDRANAGLVDSFLSPTSAYMAFDAFIENEFPLSWKTPKPAFPLLITSFPGPKTGFTICGGHPVTEMHFNYHGQKLLGMVITTLTYNEGITVVVSADQNVFPSEDEAQLFVLALEEQINKMYSLFNLKILSGKGEQII